MFLAGWLYYYGFGFLRIGLVRSRSSKRRNGLIIWYRVRVDAWVAKRMLSSLGPFLVNVLFLRFPCQMLLLAFTGVIFSVFWLS